MLTVRLIVIKLYKALQYPGFTLETVIIFEVRHNEVIFIHRSILGMTQKREKNPSTRVKYTDMNFKNNHILSFREFIVVSNVLLQCQFHLRKYRTYIDT